MKKLNENHADTNTDNLSFDYEEPPELNTINNQITADEIKKNVPKIYRTEKQMA